MPWLSRVPSRWTGIALALSVAATPAAAARAWADEPAWTPKPVPRMQVLPLPNDEASFVRDGVEVTRYHFGPQHERTFLYPIVGPSGRSLTRMGHPRDPVGHSHHNSFWVTHFKVDGVDFWGDRGQGRIVHQRMEFYEDADEAASLQALNHWIDHEGRVRLIERRRITVEPLAEREALITLDLELAPGGPSPVVLGKTSFGLVGVRMAKTIGVHDGGGMIRNSEGGVNEAGVFWKPARWCDYSGRIAPEAIEGLTLLDHPRNYNHPTEFHVRDDGWMGTSLSFDGDLAIEPGQPLRLRYGLYVHAGAPPVAALDARWRAFAERELPATLELPKKK